MKKTLFVLFFTLSINGFAQQKKIVWHTSVNKAIGLSLETGKPVFFFFTGSDWCGWCIKLKNTVFNKSEFKSWASKNVILVELDFPKRTPISDELKKQNRELAALFRVRGYPTVWFVTPKSENGNVSLNKLGSLGASPLDVNAWVGAASEIIK